MVVVLLLQAPLQLSTCRCRSAACYVRTDWEEGLWRTCNTSVKGQVCCISCQPDLYTGIDVAQLLGSFTRIAFSMHPAVALRAGLAFLL